MMDYYVHAWISLLLFIPALVGLTRIQWAGYGSRLIIFLAWLLFAAVLSELAAALGGYEVSDIDFLSNAILGAFIWHLHRRWLKNSQRQHIHWAGPSLGFVCLARLFTCQWPAAASVLLLTLCTLISFLLITMMNHIWIRHPFHLSRNPNFIVVLACLLHFVRILWMESCWLFGVSELQTVRSLMYTISALIQFIILILFCKGMLRLSLNSNWKYLNL